MGFAAFAKSDSARNDSDPQGKSVFFQRHSESRFLFHNRERLALRSRGISRASRLALALALFLAAARAQGDVRTLQEKIAQTNWSEVRGVNFVPSYASNTYEIWRNYDHEIVDRDLRMASDVGYNSVRLWL